MRSIDEAIWILNEAAQIASRTKGDKEDFAAIARLCGESRQVPLTIALHDLADFYFKRD